MRRRCIVIERLEDRRLLSVAAASSDISVEGIDRNADAPDYTIRPDCAVAAGPNDVVTVNNSSIEYYTKDGSEEGQPTALNDLFGLSYNAGWGIADEEIYFDSSLGVTGRFIVTADATNIHATDDQHPYGTTKLIVAVSQSNNLGQNSAWNINWIDTSFPTYSITQMGPRTITRSSSTSLASRSSAAICSSAPSRSHLPREH